jgi:hypothetical protein
MNGRFHDQSKTPEERIAAVCGHFTRERQHKFKRLPDDADYRDELRPFVRLEILLEVLKTLEKYGSYREALDVVNQIEELKIQIAVKHQ